MQPTPNYQPIPPQQPIPQDQPVPQYQGAPQYQQYPQGQQYPQAQPEYPQAQPGQQYAGAPQYQQPQQQFPQAPQGVDYSSANGIYCRVCGATPAANVTFRAHQGMIIIMRFRRAPGPYCRNCGLATFRKMQGESLVQGWWGYASSIINPITMLINLGPRSQVAKLPPPLPGSQYQPLDPGKPLTQRAPMLMLLVPVVLLLLIVALAVVGSSSSSSSTASSYTPSTFPSISMPSMPNMPSMPGMATTTAAAPTTADSSGDASTAKTGDCVYNAHVHTSDNDDNPDMQVVPCSDSRAEKKILGRLPGGGGESACQGAYPDFDSYYTETYTGTGAWRDYTLCMQDLQH